MDTSILHEPPPVTRHPSIEAILRHFHYEHLPPHLAEVSQYFHALAHEMADMAPNDPETTVGLRKLLEAKDCFVRARRSATLPGVTT